MVQLRTECMFQYDNKFMTHYTRKEGAVIDDDSSKARDLLDGFTNPKIVGKTKIAED
jgi:hypothetical protein